MRRLGLQAALTLLAVTVYGCLTPVKHPAPPPVSVAFATASCRDIWAQELFRAIDAVGLADCVRQFQAGATDEQVRANVRTSPEWKEKHAPKPPTPPVAAAPVIHPDGRIFRTADGKPWRYKGVSAFALFDRITRGEDVRDTLDAYKGYNVLRVWPYVPKKDWGAKAWDVTYTAADAKQYLAKLAELGWTVELTLLTDDDPGRLAWAKNFVSELAKENKPTNLLLEIGNEPTTHKNINTQALKAALDASGFVYASGNYEDSTKAFGRYGVAHSQRDPEWARRAHDVKEYYDGGGPNKPTDPAHRWPWVLDEPPKPEDVNMTADDARAYFGAASIMGAGATWHCSTGKFGLPPTPAEAQLAAAALEGLNAFPADAPNLGYGRPVENSLRTYTAGEKFMVRVRPTTPSPGGNWTRMGSSAVLWRR